MAENRTKENTRPDESQPERRIIKIRYDEITRVIEFRIFVVQPNGKKARVLGGGAFEERDLYCVAAKLANLADDFAYDEAQIQGFGQEIEESEGEDV